MERRGSRGNERRRSGMWIAAVYAILLMLDLCAQPVACLSACHDPPQVIRISRGQKITVEYWVGQNTLETGAGQQPWKPESTPTADVTTTSATSGDGDRNEKEGTTAVPLAERAPPSASPSSPITEKIPHVQPSSSTYPPATATETTTAKVNVTGSSESTLSPKTNSIAPDSEQRPLGAAVTSRSPSSEYDQNIDEQINEQESSTISIDVGQSESNTVAARQSESSTARHSPITDSEIDVINADPEVTSTADELPDITLVAESELKEELDSTSAFTSDFTTAQVDGRGHEPRELSTEYSSPDYRHQESSALSSDDGLTEIAYWAVTTPESGSENDNDLIESRNAANDDVTDVNRASTAAPSDDEESTAALLSNEQVTVILNSANETTENSGNANVTEFSVGRAEKAVDELSSTIASTELAAESTEAIVQSIDSSNATTINATVKVDNKVIQGRNNDNDTSTANYEQTTDQEIDLTTSSSIQQEPKIIKGKSVLETISTTIRAILSTLAPTTAQEELINGRNENTSIIQNSEDLPATTTTYESTTGVDESLGNNSTADKRNRGGDEQEESTNKETILIESINQNATDSSAIIFEEESSVDPLMTIDPRDPKINHEEITTIASGRAAPSSTEGATESIEKETLAIGDNSATTTEVVVILDLEDDDDEISLTEKSVPKIENKKELETNSTENAVTNATQVTPAIQTVQQKNEEDDDDVTVLRVQPESGRPAEGARKFENTDVSINGEDAKREQVEESGFRSTVINRKRLNRKPFIGRNRKPNFVRHRPPYVSLDPAGRRPPFFLRQAPSAGNNAKPAYTVDESPVASDRADPPSRTVLLDSDDSDLDPLLEDASSDGSTYYAAAPYLQSEMQQRADFLPPPESRVHYVSVMRPPDGVLPVRDLRMTYPNDKSQRRRVLLQNRNKRSLENGTNDCQWIFRSDPGVPLLLTFKSFSTPETPDCKDHYISVERESNGFQSRWCGASGDRPGHAAFARSEINLQLFSVGDGSFPTGFSVEIQALDLKLLRKYAEVRRIIKGK